MDFGLPQELTDYLAELDRFIEAEIRPLEEADDNVRFFDHRREYARTDFERGGLPRHEWEELLREARRRADKAGHLRFAMLPKFGGKGGSNLWMCVIREYLAAKGLGLHNDLQNEHSIVANNPFADGRIESLGAYLQDDMRFGKLNVLAGLRHDTVKGSAASMNNGAIKNGLTREELRAVLTQIAIYAGIPAGVECFRIAKKVFAEIDGADPGLRNAPVRCDATIDAVLAAIDG